MHAILRFICTGRIPVPLLVIAAASLSAPAARAEYRINVGDALDVSVAGLPDFHQTAHVDLDGDISLSLAGRFHAADRPLPELRAEIQKELATKFYRQTTLDGHEIQVAIKAPEINVTISEYKPIYVSGDVATPGERPYRPGMIVRQAVAVAGGYDLLHLRMENPFLESADFKSDYERMRTEVVKAQAHIARIRSELATLEQLPATNPGDTPDPKDNQANKQANGRDKDQDRLSSVKTYAPVDDQIVISESERLTGNKITFANELSFLKTLMAQIDDNLSTLEKQNAEEKEGSRMDADSLTKMQALYNKGTIPLMRYTDERRTVLLSSTRVLQTMDRMDQLKRDRAEVGRRKQKLSEQRKLDLLDALQNAEVDLAAARSKLQAAGEKLLYTGTVKSQLTRGASAKPEIVLFRAQKSGSVKIDAAEDTELVPGDVIEITLRLDYPIEGSPRAEVTR